MLTSFLASTPLHTLVIGLIGGLITGISPCILPVLPLVLAVTQGSRARPWLVIGGLITSFSAVTLCATSVLNALGLPGDVLWKVGIGLLVLVGMGMVFPRVQEVLEWPFDKAAGLLGDTSQLQAKARDKGGFAIGLAMGIVFVPCAGPVLAAISVAGATGQIDARILALTASFALGVAIPLLAFALGGNEVGQRVDAFRTHQAPIRRASGALVIVMAIALAAGAPAWLQTKLPSINQDSVTLAGADDALNPGAGGDAAGGIGSTGRGSDAGSGSDTASGNLDACRGIGRLGDCGPVPELRGVHWLSAPVDPATSGKVTLLDFWAYACINCQRANVHVTKLYDHYKDYGLDVVGIHAPEYAFEREEANVRRAAQEQSIHYAVAQDNDFTTWKAFGNHYWPAHYLVDAHGIVREIHEGEGEYARTEALVRQLLQDRDPAVQLPAPLEDSDDVMTAGRNPETYLGTARAQYYDNADYQPGEHTYVAPRPAPGRFALDGTWTVDEDTITAGADAAVLLHAHAAWVQAVVSGSGTLTLVRDDGSRETFEATDGTVDLLRSVGNTDVYDGMLRVEASPGLQLHSFTFG